MKYFKKWDEMNWYSKTTLLMVITAIIGFIIALNGYLLIGNVVIWTAVGVDGIAMVIKRKKLENLVK